MKREDGKEESENKRKEGGQNRIEKKIRTAEKERKGWYSDSNHGSRRV